jgi:osmotically-inducible protein OsmY
MRKWESLFAIGAAILWTGCSDHSGGKQASSESAEKENYGSATDISKNNGSRETNALNAADNGIGGPMARTSGNYQSQPLAGQSADEELAKKIKVAITTGSLGTTGVIAEEQLTKIDVSVKDGVVTLRGPVGTEREKQVIEKQITGLKGVNSVQNELTVGGRTSNDSPAGGIVPRPPQDR